MEKRIKEIIRNRGKVPTQVSEDMPNFIIEIDKENHDADRKLREMLL